jgi:hypothetical protein
MRKPLPHEPVSHTYWRADRWPHAPRADDWFDTASVSDATDVVDWSHRNKLAAAFRLAHLNQLVIVKPRRAS